MRMMDADAIKPAPKPEGTIPLRRATYVNVLELVENNYDINFEILADELAKLKVKQGQGRTNNSSKGGEGVSKGTGDSFADEDASSPAAEAKLDAWARTNLTVLPTLTSALPPYSKYHNHRSSLQLPRNGFNLCLLVGKVELVVDKYRVDGSRVLIAEVEVGDETGSIFVRARDEQIEMLRRVSSDGGAIVLRNCTMELYRGKHLRLAVTKWGKICPYPDGIESTPNPPSTVKYDLNFSLVDLNTVARTKMPGEQRFPMPATAVQHEPRTQKQTNASRKKSDEPGSPMYRSQGHHSLSTRQYQHRQQHQQNHVLSGLLHNVNSTGNHYLFQNEQYSGAGSANSPSFLTQPRVHHQQYNTSSANDYSTHQGKNEQQARGSPHHQFLPINHFKRQQQILHQQYDLQQRHTHQMHMLQQQQESQRRMLEQQQITRTSLIPGLNRAESHDSGEEFSLHTPVGGMGQLSPNLQPGPPPGSFPPTTNMQPNLLPPQPMTSSQHTGMNSEYQYGSMVPSPMGNVFQGEGQQQPPSRTVGALPTYVSIISPPVSPANAPHPAPKAPPPYPSGKVDGHNLEKQE